MWYPQSNPLQIGSDYGKHIRGMLAQSSNRHASQRDSFNFVSVSGRFKYHAYAPFSHWLATWCAGRGVRGWCCTVRKVSPPPRRASACEILLWADPSGALHMPIRMEIVKMGNINKKHNKSGLCLSGWDIKYAQNTLMSSSALALVKMGVSVETSQ